MKLFCRAPLYALALLAVFGVAVADADDTAVQIASTKNGLELATLGDGVKLFTNRDYTMEHMPAELNGLQFVRHGSLDNGPITFDAPAGATVYVLIDKPSLSAGLRSKLIDSGFDEISDKATFSSRGQSGSITVYKRVFAQAEHFEGVAVETLGGGIVAAERLQLASTVKSGESGSSAVTPAAVAGPTTQPASRQATIHALQIYRTDSGMMLGQTSEATLTLTAGDQPHGLALGFATPVGKQMNLARDDMLRYLRLVYPNWNVDRAELTFEDKYVNHEGGSIGAALGTLVRATIEGIAIDPAVAMTGDISANGKVRAIGGVAAKIKGAQASKMTVTAVPTDNYDQVVDGVVYQGASLVSETQVIGIATLDEAVAVARRDRDESLKTSIAAFVGLQVKAATNPAAWRSKEAQAVLAAIVKRTPQHYSAQIMLLAAQNKLPKTLSATASLYYTGVATRPALDLVQPKRGSTDTHGLQTAALKAGLTDLRKLKAIVNPQTRSLVDAWTRFFDSLVAQQSGGSKAALERQRQQLLDEMAKQQADTNLMQKMLSEGI